MPNNVGASALLDLREKLQSMVEEELAGGSLSSLSLDSATDRAVAAGHLANYILAVIVPTVVEGVLRCSPDSVRAMKAVLCRR